MAAHGETVLERSAITRDNATVPPIGAGKPPGSHALETRLLSALVETNNLDHGVDACLETLREEFGATECRQLTFASEMGPEALDAQAQGHDAETLELIRDLRLRAHAPAETAVQAGDVQREDASIWAVVLAEGADEADREAAYAVVFRFDQARALPPADVARLEAAVAFLARANVLRQRQIAVEQIDQRFQSLTKSIPGVVYQRLVTPEGDIRYTYISETAKELFGVSATEIIHNPKALFASYAPEYREGFRRRLLQASKDLTTWDVEASIIMPDGSKKFTHAIAKPRKLEDGSVLWTGVILDASRIKEAERLAAETEARTRENIIESLGQGFLMFDPSDELVLVNSHYRALQPDSAPAAEPGASYVNVIRNEVMTVDLEELEDKGRTERRFEERLALHRAGGSFVLEGCPSEDLWLQINEHRLEDGSTVVIYTDISEIRKREDRINHMALHDALTGLPNRKFLQQRLEAAFSEARRYNTNVGVFCLDLDNFKNVNDTLGHPIGDRLLCEAVARMKATLRGMDTIARLGGDEFAIVMPDVKTVGQVEAIAGRIVSALCEPFFFDGQRAAVGASVGVAIAGPDAVDPALALKHADLALYRAKSDGKNCVRLFERAMDDEAQARRVMEADLRTAIDEQQFVLYYQPQISSEDRGLTGFEALLRWRHPERGIVPPSEFIPLAEETGLVVRIGDWVLETACRTAASWPEPYRIAVNVSPVQFKRPGLVDFIKNTLEATKLNPEQLELEITETVLLRHTDENLKKLFELKNLGIRIAMDDFGTGYSSLGNLRSFPFDKIKIDRSFVSDVICNPEADAIVRAIASLGLSLGVSTTAEGVETMEQLSQVVSDGCSEIQGFYYGHPMPESDLDGFIDEQALKPNA